VSWYGSIQCHRHLRPACAGRTQQQSPCE
jgi:hypothetical protein